ncbi:MAG: hypothetical protein WBC44_19940 [Planctomycetaceae bacterium]
MMGFDVHGPTRHVTASNVDGSEPRYDLLAMPAEYGLNCPRLDQLNRRFYATTIVRFDDGSVHALRDELTRLRDAYRSRREPELITERRVRARNPAVRRAIIDRVCLEDVVYRALEEFRLLCDEAIATKTDVRCEGD